MILCIISTYSYIIHYIVCISFNIKKPYKFRIKLPGVPGAQARKEVPNPKPKIQSPPDEYLACIIREVAVTGHHVAGTCAGGKVVDDQLRYVSQRKTIYLPTIFIVLEILKRFTC